jgi:hypothetical protein
MVGNEICAMFDLRCILINEFSGSIEIFMILSLIFVMYVCARFNIESRAILILITLYILIISATISPILFAVSLIFVAIIIAPKWVKLLNK